MTYELPPKERVSIISKRLINLEKVAPDRAPGPLSRAIKTCQLALQQAIADQHTEWAQ